MPRFLIPAIATSLLAFTSTTSANQIANRQLFDGGSAPSAISSDTGAAGSNSLKGFAGHDTIEEHSAQFPQATHQASITLDRDLVGTGPRNARRKSVLEPPSLGIGAFGLLFALRFVAWKRAAYRRDAFRS
jgi:hypothetical protein